MSKLHEIVDERQCIDYSEFNEKYNERDNQARQKMHDLVDSEVNKVTKQFAEHLANYVYIINDTNL